MNKNKQLTVIVIGLVIIFLILYDLYALFFLGSTATISAVLNEWSFNSHPLITFSAGVVVGGLIVHFFEWKPVNDEDKI